MKPARIKKYRKKHRYTPDLLIRRNTAMLLGVSLPFVIATAIGLRQAVAMSLEFLVINLAAALVVALTAGWLAVWKRAIVSVAAATIVMMLARSVINLFLPDVFNNQGTYLYLMALNGITILQSERPERRQGLAKRMATSVKNMLVQSALFAALMFVVALPREYFGNGTLWGVPVSVPVKISGMLLPFCGFILAGFLLAAVRFLSKRFTYLGVLESERRALRDRARYTEIHVDS